MGIHARWGLFLPFYTIDCLAISIIILQPYLLQVIIYCFICLQSGPSIAQVINTMASGIRGYLVVVPELVKQPIISTYWITIKKTMHGKCNKETTSNNGCVVGVIQKDVVGMAPSVLTLEMPSIQWWSFGFKVDHILSSISCPVGSGCTWYVVTPEACSIAHY